MCNCMYELILLILQPHWPRETTLLRGSCYYALLIFQASITLFPFIFFAVSINLTSDLYFPILFMTVTSSNTTRYCPKVPCSPWRQHPFTLVLLMAHAFPQLSKIQTFSVLKMHLFQVGLAIWTWFDYGHILMRLHFLPFYLFQHPLPRSIVSLCWVLNCKVFRVGNCPVSL